VTAFNVAREALAPALARAAGIVPARAGIPIIQCVLLETSDEGLFVAATDTDVKYRERVDDVPRESWRGCVDAARLEAFVAGAPADGDVVLRADDEGRLSIRSGPAGCRCRRPRASRCSIAPPKARPSSPLTPRHLPPGCAPWRRR
jgi:DNA polymerase III sliding clamp (beta) subunit (PCNA family)